MICAQDLTYFESHLKDKLDRLMVCLRLTSFSYPAPFLLLPLMNLHVIGTFLFAFLTSPQVQRGRIISLLTDHLAQAIPMGMALYTGYLSMCNQEIARVQDLQAEAVQARIEHFGVSLEF